MKLSNLPAAAGELIAGCRVWEQFGMVLSPPRQAVMLAQHQAAALPDTGRIDFGGGVLKKTGRRFLRLSLYPAGRLGRHTGRADNDFLRLEE